MSRILILSPEPWEGHSVSKHHYAREMARRGHQVLFCGPPEGRDGTMRLQPVAECAGLRVLHAGRVAPGLARMPRRVRRWLEARWLARLEKAAGGRIDVIWLFENSRFFDMGFAGDRLKIYHQVDLNQDLHPEEAAASADAVFCTTGAIAARLAPHNPGVLKLHHGVQETGGAPQVLKTGAMPQALEGQGPHAVYVGNLDIGYLDVPLLAGVISAHPEVCFHLVGGYREAGALFQAVGQAANVRWWGKRPAAEIPGILAGADVLLLTYLAAQFPEQLASPHKLMEYLAAGPVTVATWTAEYADKTDLLEMTRDSADYPARLAAVLQDLPKYNSPEARGRRMAFARDHTYRAQVDRIRAHLTALGLVHDL